MSQWSPFKIDPWKPKRKPPRPMRRLMCPQCNGSGRVFKNSVWEFGWKPCKPCKGTGFIDVPIPPWSR